MKNKNDFGRNCPWVPLNSIIHREQVKICDTNTWAPYLTQN